MTSIIPSGNFWASGIATNLARLILSASYHIAVSERCSIVWKYSCGSSPKTASMITVLPVPLYALITKLLSSNRYDSIATTPNSSSPIIGLADPSFFFTLCKYLTKSLISYSLTTILASST